MKNSLNILFVLSLLLITSCRNVKDLTLIRDVEHEENIKSRPIQSINRNILIGDILYVSIKSMNPEVNMLFNPESNMESSGGYNNYQKFTDPNGAYLYGFEVDKDGNIKLPMLGKISVAGIPISEVESVVQKKAEEFLKDSIVKVKLLNFKVTVVGEIKNPGDYYNYNNSMTIVQALAMASGGTDYSSIKKVMVIRPVPEGNKSFLLDMTSKNIFMSEAFYLQPNDYVIVQPDKNKNIQLNAELYSLVISSLSLLLLTYGVFFQ